MNDPAQAYRALQKVARAGRRNPNNLLVLYTTERFLARLAGSRYRTDFVLKGGVLLAAYQVRRPTKDADMQLVDQTLDVEFLDGMVREVAAVDVDDGVVFDLADLAISGIRDGDEYQGFRVKFGAGLHTARLRVQLDISTGDPVVPPARAVVLPGVLEGTGFSILGYPLESVIAEKVVTMLQRGTVNTRWRDFLDVRALGDQHAFVAGELERSVQAVAAHRQVNLASLADLAPRFDNQRRWEVWVSALEMDPELRARWCEPQLTDQVAKVATFIDPVLTRSLEASSRWDPRSRLWN